MKRHGNLFEKIVDINNILLALENAKRGKSHYREVKKIEKDPLYYCEKIKEILESGEFSTSEYSVYEKMCGRKKRTIYRLPYFPDRIVHHAIAQVLDPIWRKTFIRDTFQSIKGRGVHDARKRICKALQNKDLTHALQIDITKFYPSIDNNLLKRFVRHKIKCNRTLCLLDDIIDSSEGLPIGNYTSQILGNVYLSAFDHFVKEILKVKYYYRYCDDILVFDNTSSKLHTIKRKILELLSLLKLKANQNHRVVKIKDGIPFIGFSFFHVMTRLAKRNSGNFKQKVLFVKKNHHRLKHKIVSVVMSYWGLVKYTNTKSLWYKYCDRELQVKMNNYGTP
jgi:RNA-directed DNA polymerase